MTSNKEIAGALRSLADSIEQGGSIGSIGGKTLARTGDPQWSQTGYLAADYWVEGRLAGMAGIHRNEYGRWETVLGIQHGDRPLHTFVVAPNLTDPLSPAMVGWVDGSKYRPKQGYKAWCDQGCPRTVDGYVLDVAGRAIGPAGIVIDIG